MTLCFSFFSDIANIVTGSLIAIAVIICLVIMLKYKESRKILGYGMGCLIILIGILSAISFFKEVNKESYINGSIDISNQFSQESFSYTNKAVVFYKDLYSDQEEYYFEIDLLKVDNFDGLNNEYEVMFNDYELINSKINAGLVTSVETFEFNDTTGRVIHSAELNIRIEFLNDRTSLTLKTFGVDSASYLEQYFLDNGFKLAVIQVL